MCSPFEKLEVLLALIIIFGASLFLVVVWCKVAFMNLDNKFEYLRERQRMLADAVIALASDKNPARSKFIATLVLDDMPRRYRGL